MRYPFLEHHCTAAGVFGSSGQSKAERNDRALVLLAECAAREQAVADLSKDNSLFATVFLARIIRALLTLVSGIVALICRRGGIEVRFLATLVVTVKLRASQVQTASSLVFSALDYPALVSVLALSPARLRHERIANKAHSVAVCIVALGSNAKLRHRGWSAHSTAKTASYFLGALVYADRDKASTPGKAEVL